MAHRPKVRVRRLLLAFGAICLVVLVAAPGGGGAGNGEGRGRDRPSRERSSNGRGAPSWQGLAVIGGAVGLAVVGFAVYYRLKRPLRLTELAVVLPGGAIPELDALMGASDFSTPAARSGVLAALAAIVQAHGVRDGWVRLHAASRQAAVHVVASATLYRERMAAAGLSAHDAAVVRAARAADAPSPACLLGIITTVRGNHAVEAGGREAAGALLGALAGPAAAAPLLLYVYYAPDPHQHLSEGQALDLLRRLGAPA